MVRAMSASTPGRSLMKMRTATTLLLAGEFAHHDRGGEPRVDVAAGEDEPDAPAAEALRVGEDGGKAGGAGALGHGLLQHQIGGDRLLDRALGDQHHVVDVAADDLQRQLADVLDRDAFGQRLAADLRRSRRAARPTSTG